MRIVKPEPEVTYFCDMCGVPICENRDSMVEMQWQFAKLNCGPTGRDFREGGPTKTEEADLCLSCRKVLKDRLKKLFASPESEPAPWRTAFNLCYQDKLACYPGKDNRVLCKTYSLAEAVTWLTGGGANRGVRVFRIQAPESRVSDMLRHPGDLLRAYQGMMEDREVEARRP